MPDRSNSCRISNRHMATSNLEQRHPNMGTNKEHSFRTMALQTAARTPETELQTTRVPAIRRRFDVKWVFPQTVTIDMNIPKANITTALCKLEHDGLLTTAWFHHTFNTAATANSWLPAYIQARVSAVRKASSTSLVNVGALRSRQCVYTHELQHKKVRKEVNCDGRVKHGDSAS